MFERDFGAAGVFRMRQMGAEKRIGLVPRGSRVMSPDGDWGTQQQIRPSGSSFNQARLGQCHELTDHSHGAVGCAVSQFGVAAVWRQVGFRDLL